LQNAGGKNVIILYKLKVDLVIFLLGKYIYVNNIYLFDTTYYNYHRCTSLGIWYVVRKRMFSYKSCCYSGRL